ELHPKSWTLLEVIMGIIHDLEFKLQVVRMYDEGKEGCWKIAQKMGIHPSMVHRWVSKYHSMGEEGLENRRTHPKYTEDFKQKVKKEIRENVSVNSLVCKYNLSPSTIRRWRVECGMSEEKIITDEELEQLRRKFKNTKDPDIKLLLEKLEYAKMENDILKKLATLVRARKGRKQKQSEN
ncbi:MAG: helix-turn-helix domain-containing protein, partial [Treponema sp.]|nr:helix-turn-helix domain-containing protein [Treponema sp.]